MEGKIQPTDVDINTILTALEKLPPGKRHKPSEYMKRIAAGASKARGRGTPWTMIVDELKENGVAISVARLKKLIDAQVNENEIGWVAAEKIA